MALKFLPSSMHSLKTSESDFVSLIGASDRYIGDEIENAFGLLFDDLDVEDFYEFPERGSGNECGGPCMLIANDILDLLPSDPFGMDLSFSTFTEIADWLDDFELESQLNLIENRTMAVQLDDEAWSFVWDQEACCFESSQGICDSMLNSSSFPVQDSYKAITNDILEMLPVDPFGMDLSAATFSAIFDWLEDFEIEYRLNLFLDREFVFESPYRNLGITSIPELRWTSNELVSLEELGFIDGNSDGGCDSMWNADGSSIINDNAGQSTGHRPHRFEKQGDENCLDGDGGAPHDALLLSLGFLGLKDLLSMEGVCRSLRAAVRDDPLLWRTIHIDQPLNERITDNVLLNLTRRAQGFLHSLSLVDCSRITDDGISQVLERNPKLTKLGVPGCTKLSIGGLVNNLKLFQSRNIPGIKCLRVGGIYGVTTEDFEDLCLLLRVDKCQQPEARKPQFFHSGYSLPSHDDDSPIDIEMCPRCQKLRLVYDCPVQSCQRKQNSDQQCRACKFCIARCGRCGRCLNDSEYEETFCLDLVCLSCSKQAIGSQ